ncbi:MAG: SAM-dependent methyltransferase [Salibacteraceae bacterium]
MKFSDNDISDYYHHTQSHYDKWWNLKDNLSIHYGLWFEGTKDFDTALKNTDREMAKYAGICKGQKILDAGCGVGGAALFLVQEFDCYVEGVTLSSKQVNIANAAANQLRLSNSAKFTQQSFSKTNFENNSFDVVWACESTCYANPKEDFLTEAFRVLKPGGKVIILDYFTTPKGLIDKNKNIKNWTNLWAIEKLYNWPDLSIALSVSKLKLISRKEYTKEVTPSAKKMHYRSFLGAIGSELYNLFHNTTRFAKKHYQSGFYQYKALKNKEWEYWMVCLQKPINNPSKD